MRRLLVWAWVLSVGYVLGHRDGEDRAARDFLRAARAFPGAETLFHGE